MDSRKKLSIVSSVLILAAIALAVGTGLPARDAAAYGGPLPTTGPARRICTDVICPLGYVKDRDCRCVPVLTTRPAVALAAWPVPATVRRGCVDLLCPRGYVQTPDCRCVLAPTTRPAAALAAWADAGSVRRGCLTVLCPTGYVQTPDCRCVPGATLPQPQARVTG